MKEFFLFFSTNSEPQCSSLQSSFVFAQKSLRLRTNKIFKYLYENFQVLRKKISKYLEKKFQVLEKKFLST